MAPQHLESTNNGKDIKMSIRLSDRTPDVSYQNTIYGTYGIFESAGGKVEYLSTKASLERNSSSNEARLTENLLPVREALPINLLDFDALLQRDLDDHRVSISLIPC
jgi:hypothetical protein